MTIPTYDRFIEPVLRYLARHPEGVLARDAHDAAADALNLSPAQRAETLPSGRQAIDKNRAGWAHDRLKRAGLSESTRRGFWCLTAKGRAYVKAHPRRLSEDTVLALATEHNDVILAQASSEAPASGAPAPTASVETPAASPHESPDDRLEAALAELRRGVMRELLETLAQVHPTQFEKIVLELLHRMGYGASAADVTRVGGSGDEGIDGIISLDKLGLEKVYVQAKRWQNAVGRPEVQSFKGALAGQRAMKGVFITTSGFTKQAVEFARTIEGLVLVDGERLAGLMIDHGVGVQSRIEKIPQLDRDYFEDQ